MLDQHRPELRKYCYSSKLASRKREMPGYEIEEIKKQNLLDREPFKADDDVEQAGSRRGNPMQGRSREQ